MLKRLETDVLPIPYHEMTSWSIPNCIFRQGEINRECATREGTITIGNKT